MPTLNTARSDALLGRASPVIAWTRHGLACYADGDFEHAAELFSAVAEAIPDKAFAWNNLALALGALQRHEGAVAALRRSLNCDPVQPAIWTSMANTLLQLGRVDEAERACIRAIKRDPRVAAPWQIRALIGAHREDFAAAAAAFAKTIELGGDNPSLRANLGTMLFKSGRFADAASSLALAADLDPASIEVAGMARMTRFVASAALGDIDGATALYAYEIAAGNSDLDTVFKTALLYLDRFEYSTAAAQVAKAWVACRPDNIEARHLCHAAVGKFVDRMPAELVTHHFDAFAEHFDDRLVGQLGYEMPVLIAGLLSRHLRPEGSLKTLDIGCGTGLCGAHLRSYSSHLAGVDLSSRMIEKARERALYDALWAGELMLALKQNSHHWDLIAATDVVPYFGKLELLVAAVAAALKPGGYFAFTTESSDQPGDRPGETGDVVLRGSGRYAHGRDYVAACIAGLFDVVETGVSAIRNEGGRPLNGIFYLLRRR